MLELQTFNSHHFPPEHTVARGPDPDNSLCWMQLLADVTATRHELRASDHCDWALFHSDSYRFTVGLLALLAENRRAYLPGDTREASLAALRERGLKLLGEFSSTDALAIETGAPSSGQETFQLGGEIIIFTSGSTGSPKAIGKSLRQLDAELALLEAEWGPRLEHALVVGSVSHQHFYGLLFRVLWPLCSGRAFWRHSYIDPAVMVREILALADAPAIAWIASPAQLHRLGENMPWSILRKRLTTVFSSGGPVQPAAALAIHRALGESPLEVLGSSETGGIAWRAQSRGDSAWRPLPGVETRVDGGGGLQVRSPMLTDSNWYTTADAATALADGRFQLTGRLDRIVKLEGKRVSLAQVEQLLRDSPWVADCAVTVIERRRRVLGALWVPSDAGLALLAENGMATLKRRLRASLLAALPAVAVPRILRPAAELPRNSQGKVLHQQVTTAFAAQHLPLLLRQQIRDNHAELILYLSPDSRYFRGHFPGAPILPGVVQLYWAESFGRACFPLVGGVGDMKAVKFQTPVRPGSVLELRLEHRPERNILTFDYRSGAVRHSQGRLLFREEATCAAAS